VLKYTPKNLLQSDFRKGPPVCPPRLRACCEEHEG